jgi:flagellar basal-body rod protein FlgC
MMVELADMREANRSYEANVQMVKQSRALSAMMVDLLRS